MDMTEPFELLDVIGRGGMGTVWRARDNATGAIVAVKLMHEMFAEEPEYVRRFEHEVEAARRVSSPYVVKTFGFGRRGNIPYLTMEYIEGGTLKEKLAHEGPMSWEDARGITREMAMALQAAHTVGVVHRDVKPSNIMFTSKGHAKLGDFGVAKALDVTRMTATSTMLGTIQYMAPETGATAQSDLYSLGCVLYEMLAGHAPFTGDQTNVLRQHLTVMPDTDGMDSSAARVIHWLTAKQPGDRPPSAAALRQVLEGTASAPSSRGVIRRRKMLVFSGLAAGIVALVGVAVAIPVELSRSDGTPYPSATVVAVDSARTISDGVLLHLDRVEALGDGSVRIHERLVDDGKTGWGWAFDRTGGTYIRDHAGNLILPSQWSTVAGGVSTGAQSSFTVAAGGHVSFWVEFPPFPGQSEGFTFHDDPADFLNLRIPNN